MPKILLTEDQADQRRLYHEVLAEAGFEVVDARSGADALGLFQSTQPDLVVLDIQMPGIDGVDALGKILSKARQVPVILYSAFPAYKSNFLTWSADAFVVKTGDPGELVAAVVRLCEERGIELPAAAKVTQPR